MTEAIENQLEARRADDFAAELAELERQHQNPAPAPESQTAEDSDADLNEDDEQTSSDDVPDDDDRTESADKESKDAETNDDEESDNFFENLNKAPKVTKDTQGQLPAAAQKRVDRAVAEAKSAQARIQVLEQKLNALSANPAPTAPVTPAPVAEETVFDPTELLTNPAALDSYIAKQTDKRLQKAFEDRKAEAAKLAHEALRKKESEELHAYVPIVQKAEEEFSEAIADYDKTVDSIQNVLNIPNIKKELILCGDAAPKVAYYLGKHPKLAQELATMRPERMIREIAKIEQLSRTKSVKKSNAPKPVTSGRQGSTTNTTRKDISIDELGKMVGIPDRSPGRKTQQIIRK